MGFFESVKKIGLNIVTFGAHGRLEVAKESYDSANRSLCWKRDEVIDAKKQAEIKMKSLIDSKILALQAIKLMEVFSTHLTVKDRTFVETQTRFDIPVRLETIQATISLGEMATKGLTGVSAGIATAAGAWALAGWAGTASTGIAIGELSGVAATNATLAWRKISAGINSLSSGTIPPVSTTRKRRPRQWASQ